MNPRCLSSRHPAFLIATWFGAGLLPKAPGTWGSLAALPLGWALAAWGGPLLLAAAATLLFFVGWWASAVYVKRSGIADPAQVVVDEVVGQWLALLPAPLDPLLYFAAFLLFRLFDIRKPWPVGWADREIAGGLGVMLDDVQAGGYAALVLALALTARW